MSDRAQAMDDGAQQLLNALIIVLVVATSLVADLTIGLPTRPPNVVHGPPLPLPGVATLTVAGAVLLLIAVAWSYWEVRRHDA